VRDVAEAEGTTFTRCLDLMTALHLLQIERPQVFRSEDWFKGHCHIWQEEAPSPRLVDLLSH
jgi:hypothetical protein